MKRLHPLYLTPEDSEALMLALRRTWKPALVTLIYMRADRRDADLMNWAQTIRRIRAGGYRMSGPLNDRVSSADPNPIDYGGEISRYRAAPEHP